MNAQLKSKAPSTFTKMRQMYWEAKQSFNKSLGQREDSCIVSSDAELDIRIELLQTADNHFNDLMRVLLEYTEALQDLMDCQDNLGMSLIEYGTKDSTAAGRIMCMSGKSISRAGQKQSQLKTSLMHLFYEVETFQFKATADALQSINKMEKARRSYRSGLMWLKNESADVDPDVTKKIKNFRRVQEHIKRLKVRFDGVKLECMQKIDLFLLSRSNLFSHTLVPYIKMFKKISKHSSSLMEHTLKNIPLCLSYNFVALKELNEYSKVFQMTLQQQCQLPRVPKAQKNTKKNKEISPAFISRNNTVTMGSKHSETDEQRSSEESHTGNMLLIDLSGDRRGNKSEMEDKVQEAFNPKYSDDLLAIDFRNYLQSSNDRFSLYNNDNCFEKPLLDFSSQETAPRRDDDLKFWSLMQGFEQTSNLENSTVTSLKQTSDILSQTKWNEILVQFDPFLEEKSKRSKEETLELC